MKFAAGAKAQELHRFNQLKKQFAFYDANHSGMLEWHEFEVFLRDMYEPRFVMPCFFVASGQIC